MSNKKRKEPMSQRNQSLSRKRVAESSNESISEKLDGLGDIFSGLGNLPLKDDDKKEESIEIKKESDTPSKEIDIETGEILSDKKEEPEHVVEEVEAVIEEKQIETQSPSPSPAPVQKVYEEVSDQAKKDDKLNAISLFSTNNKRIAKTFKIPRRVVEDFDNMFEDSRGRKLAGTKGMMSNFATNALIEYMVKVGYKDESYLENLIDIES